MTQINLAIFASGNGTNAEELFSYFNKHATIAVKGVLTNNPKAYVITRAQRNNVPCHIFDRKSYKEGGQILAILDDWQINAIILAGFLWLIPEYLIHRYRQRIINIHPALLPKFGGKGMYGMRVHQAVLDSGEPESGITIHLVNERYDEGRIIFQKKCAVESGDTPESLAEKIHKLEHHYYPRIIEKWLTGNITPQPD